LAGGNHSRIEGPYILYNQTTGYYYLFLSFGGLDARGGYNIRVARAQNPDGPYFDAQGQDMIDAHGPRGKYLEDQDPYIEPYGVKMIGNFLFQSDYEYYGYTSPGHNSACYDPAAGKYFLIFHTRFPRMGEYHEVRVHQMFFNADGWPVIPPLPYAWETVEKLSAGEAAGSYLYINHGKEISRDRKTAVETTLNKDGTLSGAVTGTWQLKGDYRVELVIDGSLYKGLFLRQWDPAAGAFVMTFSAVSEEGVTVWGKESAAP